ncbi:hypothetical protein AB0M46_36575 [Dactylosporangium sp. NPDC051485]|uniref:hypothetical protein n=1 Tax=Dactylosporangium sp. NPDC051485 TaxID=3154846 RepID=UPI00343AE9FF
MHPEELPDGRLGELLRAAAAPGRPHELAGEDAAVAGFRRAYRPVNRRRRRAIALSLAGLAAVSVGGTAYAAGTGHLPDPVRAWIGENDRPSTAPADQRPSGRPRATATAGPASSVTASFVPAEACQRFLAFRADPHARPVAAEERQELARLAGGQPAIEEYCRRLLAVAPSGSAAVPTPAGSSGNGNGNKGDGNNGSDSNSNSGNGRQPSHPAHPSHP